MKTEVLTEPPEVIEVDGDDREVAANPLNGGPPSEGEVAAATRMCSLAMARARVARYSGLQMFGGRLPSVFARSMPLARATLCATETFAGAAAAASTGHLRRPGYGCL